MKASSSTVRYWVVGAGRVGSWVARAAHAHGVLAGITTRDPSRVREEYAHAPDVCIDHVLPAQLPDACVVLLCVSDALLPVMTPSWIALKPVGVAHFSGALGVDFMRSENKSVALAAIHPLLSVATRDVRVDDTQGILFGVTADDAAKFFVEEIASWFSGIVIPVPGAERTRWHLAATLASNGVYALLQIASEMIAIGGISDPRVTRGLAHLSMQSAGNIVDVGLHDATTGPVVRGDATTVQRHLDAMRDQPDARAMYIAMTRALMTIAETRGLSDRELIGIRALIESFGG